MDDELEDEFELQPVRLIAVLIPMSKIILIERFTPAFLSLGGEQKE
ncbi:MAG: hypothetical protein ABI206_11075 [Antricoccus sp.]